MKLSALAVLLLALGTVLGLALRNTVFDAEAANPSSLQQREDQISIVEAGVTTGLPANTYGLVRPSLIVALDPADYPPSATFRLETILLTWEDFDIALMCVRLFDLTAAVPVSGTELCYTPPEGESSIVRLRSAPIQLPSGEHEYSIEGKCESSGPDWWCGSASIRAARVIAEWSEQPGGGGGGNSPNIGEGVVPAMTRSAFVPEPAVTANSHVTVTLTGDPGNAAAVVQWVERQPASGFIVHLRGAVSNETTFTYQIEEPAE